jgi:TetR/AcrR family transcriptional regulator
MVKAMAEFGKTKQKILNAALKEFATFGYVGARMEKIARRAEINKAMLFYYFSSKDNLYQEVLKHVLKKIFPRIRLLAVSEDSPETFLEKLPEIYIRIISHNQDFIRMITFDFIRQNDSIRKAFSDFFGKEFNLGPRALQDKISQWHRQGKISETEPDQFLINIISLSIFPFIARPIIESILHIKITDPSFIQKRIDSVINLLKRGMLT